MSQRFGILIGSRLLARLVFALTLSCVFAERSSAQATEHQKARVLEGVLRYRHFWMGDTTAVDVCSTSASAIAGAVSVRWSKALHATDCMTVDSK